MAVILTVGTNSYATVAEATAYFDERLWSDDWYEFNIDQQAQALITATKAVDRLTFKGRKKSITQVLKFPRCYELIESPPTVVYIGNLMESWDGRYCETDTPEQVKTAVYEEALAILDRGNNERAKLQREGIQSFSLGSLSETYKLSAGRGLLSIEAKELLKPYIAGAVRIR